MLPVHCCCEPAKRLGWVPVSKARQRIGRINFTCGYPKTDLTTGAVTRALVVYTEIDVVRVLVRKPEPFYCEHDHLLLTVPVWVERLAVKSADLGLDTWKKVTGFIEDHGYGEEANEEEDTRARARG